MAAIPLPQLEGRFERRPLGTFGDGEPAAGQIAPGHPRCPALKIWFGEVIYAAILVDGETVSSGRVLEPAEAVDVVRGALGLPSRS